MKTRWFAALILSLLLFSSGLHVTKADGFFITFSANGTGTCTISTFSIPVTITFNVPTPGPLPSIVTDTLNGAVVSSGEDDFGLAGAGSFNAFEEPGIDTGFPVAEPYTYDRVISFKFNGATFARIEISFTCAGGVATNQSVTSTAYVVPGNGGAPPLPNGFVLRTITCNTPLYETAGGQVVPGGAAITAGQTWFVNPTPVQSATGDSWTELFAGGFSDGFLPTACVGGKPADYAGN